MYGKRERQNDKYLLQFRLRGLYNNIVQQRRRLAQGKKVFVMRAIRKEAETVRRYLSVMKADERERESQIYARRSSDYQRSLQAEQCASQTMNEKP